MPPRRLTAPAARQVASQVSVTFVSPGHALADFRAPRLRGAEPSRDRVHRRSLKPSRGGDRKAALRRSVGCHHPVEHNPADAELFECQPTDVAATGAARSGESCSFAAAQEPTAGMASTPQRRPTLPAPRGAHLILRRTSYPKASCRQSERGCGPSSTPEQRASAHRNPEAASVRLAPGASATITATGATPRMRRAGGGGPGPPSQEPGPHCVIGHLTRRRVQGNVYRSGTTVARARRYRKQAAAQFLNMGRGR